MKYKTIVADPPWRFNNSKGKVAPEYNRLYRYSTMSLDHIASLGPQVLKQTSKGCHLYLWVPTALLNEGLKIMASWGFDFKTSLYWVKVTKDNQLDRSCMGFYYRNVVEPCLFGTLDGTRTKHFNVPNVIYSRKTGHSIKPDNFYDLVMHQSRGPYLEMFARQHKEGWDSWGNEIKTSVLITTDLSAIQTWKDVVEEVLGSSQIPITVSEIYVRASSSLKVISAIRKSQKWRAQIRRTLQRHFYPGGRGTWRAA